MTEPLLEIKSIKISDVFRQLADALDKVGVAGLQVVHDEDGDVKTIGEHLTPLLIKARRLTIVMTMVIGGGRWPPKEECIDMDAEQPKQWSET